MSVGPPMHYDVVRVALYPQTAEVEDVGDERLRRFLQMVAGEPVTPTSRPGSRRSWAGRRTTALPGELDHTVARTFLASRTNRSTA